MRPPAYMERHIHPAGQVLPGRRPGCLYFPVLSSSFQADENMCQQIFSHNQLCRVSRTVLLHYHDLSFYLLNPAITRFIISAISSLHRLPMLPSCVCCSSAENVKTSSSTSLPTCLYASRKE